MKVIGIGVVVASLAIASGGSAVAQTCLDRGAGAAEVTTGGVSVTLAVAASGILKVNGASCGFAAATIEVVGVAGNDSVTVARTVPASVPVSMNLGAGTNTVRVDGTTGNDSIRCSASGIDRDGDADEDIAFPSGLPLALTIDGGAGDDVVDCAAYPGRITLNGGTGAGNDTLIAGSSNDSLTGGAGNDTLEGGAGNDRITGGEGDDDLSGGPGNDTFDEGPAASGADAITGGDGRDTVDYSRRTAAVVMVAGVGEDTLTPDVEVVPGGKASDSLDFGSWTIGLTIDGGTGDDVLIGGSGPDRLYGRDGADTLIGNGGADIMTGDAGADSLLGGPARDTMDAGEGDDSIGPSLDGAVENVRCGPGEDSYHLNPEDKFPDCEDTPDFTSGDRIAAGYESTCAILADDRLKCWGTSWQGQAGLGDQLTRGDEPGEMGANLPAVQLGTGRRPVALGKGYFHTCVILDNGTVKCWGSGLYGVLGGSLKVHGDQPGEMGDALPTVNLGTGHAAVALAVGGTTSCVLLYDGSVKCWGWNISGELGLGDTAVRGYFPADMGDALPAIALGTGRTATAIAAGANHTCAVLDDGSLKCWGRNDQGQLGLGDQQDRGDQPGEMGDALPAIDLGTGRSAVAVTCGYAHTCALLDDASVKCWGTNWAGQLGAGHSQNRGGQPGQMGDDLGAVNLGTGRTAMAIDSFENHTCAVLDDDSVKCWGYNWIGQLGLGLPNDDNRGDQPGEMGDALPAVDLGTGRTWVTGSVGVHHVCTMLDDDTLKCWGGNWMGQLGQGDLEPRGDQPGEMGDGLPTVDLGGPLAVAAPDATRPSEDLDRTTADPLGANSTEPDQIDEQEGCAVGGRGAHHGAALVLLLFLVARRRSRA